MTYQKWLFPKNFLKKIVLRCWRVSHAVDRKNGVYSGRIRTQRIYKSFDAECWAARVRGVQNFWGLAEVARGARDDGGGGIWTVRKSRPHWIHIYTPTHDTPTPLSLCSKDTPIHTNAPIHPNKKRQPKPAFPPLQLLTLCRPQQLFQLPVDDPYLQPLFPLFQGVPPSRPTQTLLTHPLHIGYPTHQQA